MLTSHEIFGFVSPALAQQILEHAFEHDRALYRSTVNAVAEAKKVRPVFLERKARPDRNRDIVATLAKPRLELAAATLLRGWLLKKNQAMLADFLDTLEVKHKEGAVDDLPATIEDAKLHAAVDKILAKYPAEEVAVYLNAFYTMNQVTWPKLKDLLENDPRLQFGA